MKMSFQVRIDRAFGKLVLDFCTKGESGEEHITCHVGKLHLTSLRLEPSKSAGRSQNSSEDLFYNSAVHVGETKISSIEAIAQFFVVQAEQVQDRCV